MMKKILISGIVILAFIGYVFRNKFGEKNDEGKVTAPTNLGNGSTTTTTTTYKDGTYTGSVADAFYGNVQVKVTVSGNKISDVTFLQYPNDRPNSVQINQQAMPLLTQEAIQTQSASVNVISGATQTSQAFVQSLRAALSQAA